MLEVKWMYIQNIALIALAGFICGIFNTVWGLLVLALCSWTVKKKEA